jgi:esterase
MTQARMLSGKFKVFTPDLRNHGLSPHTPEFSYELMAGDVRYFIESVSGSPVSIIGHSMGGKLAMRLASEHPELLEKLVVVDIVPKVYTPHHDAILNGLNALPLEKITSRQDADQFLASYVSNPGVRQFLLKNLTRNPEGFNWKINLSSLTANMGEVLSDPMQDQVFTGPTLFIIGSKSDYFVSGDEKKIRKHFPSSEISFIDTGHWVQAEKPEEFVAMAEKFLLA